MQRAGAGRDVRPIFEFGRLPGQAEHGLRRSQGPLGRRSKRDYLESPRPLKNGVITQNNGVMDPFLKGYGESRYLNCGIGSAIPAFSDQLLPPD